MVRKKLIPEIEQRYFTLIPWRKEGPACDREFLITSPFGEFEREGSGGLEKIEIQFHPYNVAFRLNFGVVPPEGQDTFGGHLAQREIIVGWLDMHYSLCPKPKPNSWFSVRRRFYQKPTTNDDYEKLVDYTVSLLPEIDQVLASGVPGPHTWRVDIRDGGAWARLPFKLPAFYWYDGYVGVAERPFEIIAGSASAFRELTSEATQGKLHLLDAYGRSFDIVDFERVPPFGGVSAIPHLLKLSTFAIPVVNNKKQLSLEEFKREILDTVARRVSRGNNATQQFEAAQQVRNATSFRAAIMAAAPMTVL